MHEQGLGKTGAHSPLQLTVTQVPLLIFAAGLFVLAGRACTAPKTRVGSMPTMRTATSAETGGGGAPGSSWAREEMQRMVM